MASSMQLDRIVEHFNCGMGVVLNLLLIYVIRRFSRIELGTYKYLLAGFSAYDLYLSIIHAIVNPKTLRVNTTYGTVAHSYIESAHLLSFYYACFSISFALLNIHFLYRYWTIRHPHLVSYFSQLKFITLIGFYLAGQYILWHFIAMTIAPEPDDPSLPVLREAFKEIYNDTVTDGWLIMDHWKGGHFNYATLTGLLPSFVIMGAQFSAATYLGWGAYKGIAMAESISQAHRSFQLKILIAVCAQTFVPLFFVYLPYSCIFSFPLLGIPDCGISFVFPVLVSFFPAWDAIVITSFIKDYREGVLRLLGFKSGKTTSSAVDAFTVSKDMTTATTTSTERWAEPAK